MGHMNCFENRKNRAVKLQRLIVKCYSVLIAGLETSIL